MLRVPAATSLLHVTHWKAGSQWFRGIFADAFGDALIGGDYFEAEGVASRIEQGKVYTGMYYTKQEYDSMSLPQNARRVVVVRDLRDTLISAYFSIRYSHGLYPSVLNRRYVLNSHSQEEGLLYLMESWLQNNSLIHRSWLEAGERCYKLEDFMKAPEEQMGLVFKAWGLECDRQALKDLMQKHAYEKYSGGRRPGQEDLQSHYRKGVEGDWKAYFTPKVTAHFKRLFADVLIMGGYEKDASW